MPGVYNCHMPRVMLCVLALSLAAVSLSAEPLIDNERVTVWDTMTVLPPMQHDFVAVSFAKKTKPVFGHKGEIAGTDGARTAVIELKDPIVAPMAKTSGYPLAFPRPHAKKILENARVIAWSVRWLPGEPTPMHYHDKDAVAVYKAGGVLQSTTPDGKTVTVELKAGDIRFNRRDRAHQELLVSGKPHAVIVELK
jgi:hypothetical protein